MSVAVAGQAWSDGVFSGEYRMAIEVACDCGKRYRVKDELAGKRARCPACKAVIAIDAPHGANLLADAITRDAGPTPRLGRSPPA